MREAFTTFITDEPFPVTLNGDLIVTVNNVQEDGNLDIDVKSALGETLNSDAHLSSYCIARLGLMRGKQMAKGMKFYIRTVLIARDADPETQVTATPTTH